MKETKTHWKKLHNPDYFGAYCLLPGQEITVTIKTITLEEVVGQGGKKDQCTVARFKENQKPLILNVTNQKTIQKIYGTPYIEEWEGKLITLIHTIDKIQGEPMEVVRVKASIPKTVLPTLDVTDKEKMEKALSAISSGNTTIEAISKHYSITPKALKLLQDAK